MIPATQAVRDEVARVTSLAHSLSATEWSAPSRCDGWTIADVVGHLATVFDRYLEWLDDSLAGMLDPPYPPEHFGADNALRLESFTGVPGPQRLDALERSARSWLERLSSLDPATPQRHPRGVMTIETQAWRAAGECAIHGWDIATALGLAWPAPAAIAEIARVRGVEESWEAVLSDSGRTPRTLP